MNKSTFKIEGSNIVVTGAAGFIGSHLTEKLIESGARVKALVRYNSKSDTGWLKVLKTQPEIIFGDVTDAGFTDKLLTKADAVFHLAALIGIPYSYTAVESYIKTNVNGTLNILQSAQRHELKKVIITSTSEVYGTAIETPINESHPLQPQSPYSASKISADMLAISFNKSFNMPITIVRPFNTYGPRQSMRAVIPGIIAQLINSQSIKLGDTRPQRDFLYVSDTVRGFMCALERGKPDASIYNLATGFAISIKDLADKIMEIDGSKKAIVTDRKRIRPDNSEVFELRGDYSRACEHLGFKPLTSLEEGLNNTFEWIKNNPELYAAADKYHR